METTKALNQEALEQISGGGVDMTHLVTRNSNQCMHPHEYKTGEQREDYGDNAVEIQGDRLEQHGDRLILRHAAAGEVPGHGAQPAA